MSVHEAVHGAAEGEDVLFARDPVDFRFLAVLEQFRCDVAQRAPQLHLPSDLRAEPEVQLQTDMRIESK